jgi:CBS domain-containing protein
MMTVNDILKEKGSVYYSVKPDTITIDALHLMADKNIGAVLVVENGKLIGLFSERDYARKIVLQGKSSANTQVSEFMSSNLTVVNPTTFITDCMQLITDKHVRHLPVIENDHIMGIVSIGDIVSRIIHEQKFTIEQLQNYISNG